jgi:hypothetical protein
MGAHIVLGLTLLAGGATGPVCAAAREAPVLDHVLLATRDLDRAAAGFARLGFRHKPGRLHANGLRNRHIELRDGTSLELMTLEGRPGDLLARLRLHRLPLVLSVGIGR